MPRPCLTDQLRMAALGPDHVVEDHAENPNGNRTGSEAARLLRDDDGDQAAMQAKILGRAEGR